MMWKDKQLLSPLPPPLLPHFGFSCCLAHVPQPLRRPAAYAFLQGGVRHPRPVSAAPLTLLQLTNVKMTSLGLTDVWIKFSSANASTCLLRRQEKCYRERDGVSRVQKDGGSEPPMTRGLAWPEEETSLPSWNPGPSGSPGSETTAELHPEPQAELLHGPGASLRGSHEWGAKRHTETFTHLPV